MSTADNGRSVARPRRVQDFQDLMQQRVESILLVASPYDSFILAEDGQLNDRIVGEFLELGLRHTPDLTWVATGAEALARARSEERYNLIIATPQVADMSAAALARQVRVLGLSAAVVVLAFDSRGLSEFLARNDTSDIERIFQWQGDVRILLAIVKYLEDKWNLSYDTDVAGVPLILVVEDSIRYYSSFLPLIYTELVHHSQSLIAEGMNLSHKILRSRARPKLILASTFEEAWTYFSEHRENVLGVISDVEFPLRGGAPEQSAGVDLAKKVREAAPDIPIVLHSSRPQNEALARSIGAPFLLKGSPVLLNDLRRLLVEQFSFGDFVFRMRDGSAVGRAHDLRELEDLLQQVPAESIAFHGERNHFSMWLRARTEFALADRLRPRRISDYPDAEAVRADLIQSIAEYRRDISRGIVADFDRRSTDEPGEFRRLGGGSIGGKARGLAFVRRMLAELELERKFEDVRIIVPPTVVIGTDVFDRFLDQNNLRAFVIASSDDTEIRRRIMAGELPADAQEDLAAFAAQFRRPLAVRSSSLLEDSQYQPFTGVYETYMLSNTHPDPAVRLEQLHRAVKGVYASTFSQHAKAYLRATPYRLEEEKMAVILQGLVGAPHGPRFYPDFAGVARSVNFYPAPPVTTEDGIVAVALGLGRTVVDGGACMRFCPRYPRHLVQFSSVADVLENSQREFWALELAEGRLGMDPEHEMREHHFGLERAEEDGVLWALGSTYSPENDAVYDGLSRSGVRLVSFAPILKMGLFPLAEIITELLAAGAAGMGAPVEIEFAVNMHTPAGTPKEFAFLQMRPLALSREFEELELGIIEPAEVICYCTSVLGNGRLGEIRDLVVVDYHRFERSRSLDAAAEIAQLNAELTNAGTPYVLVGVGRWGSSDPWLGVPVTWDQISGARVIVESGFRDFKVAPSQGTHFFQNLTAFQVGYFTVNPQLGEGFIDWDWLTTQPAVSEGAFVRHIRLPAPVEVKMNGKKREGVITKPRGA